MEPLGLVSLALSVVSVAASLYVWLVKTNRERPRLKSYLLGGFDWDPNVLGTKTYRLRGVEVLVVNESTLPNAVIGVLAFVKDKDGRWIEASVEAAGVKAPFNIAPMQGVPLTLGVRFELPAPPGGPPGWADDAALLEAHRRACLEHGRACLARPLQLKVRLRAVGGKVFDHVLSETVA